MQNVTDTAAVRTLTIAEIHDLCEERGVLPQVFWSHAMGGDRAALPADDVERCLRELAVADDV